MAWAPFIRKSPLPGDLAKSVIVQFARGDQTVPNPTATALIRSGDLSDRATFFRNDLAFAAGSWVREEPAHVPDQYWRDGPGGDGRDGRQTQIGVFFATDGALTIDPDGTGTACLKCRLPGALPEDLGFIP